jgi:HD-GYP domain-containing protein (c-di-GMP phosphodiesterase class II)
MVPKLTLTAYIATLSVALVLLGGRKRRAAGAAAGGVLMGWGLSRLVGRPLRQLAKEAEAVRHFDFSDRPVVRSAVREVDQVAYSFDLMRDTVRQFLDLNQALAGEDDFERLLPRLLAEMTGAAVALGGVLYLAKAGGDVLQPGALRIGEADTPRPALPDLRLAEAPRLLLEAVASRRLASGRLTGAELRHAQLAAEFAEMDALAVPLYNRHEHLVGALLLFGEQVLQPALQSFVTKKSASAALTLETRELVRDQKALFKSLIEMIASAIDAQSPYTGGHCKRVPVLTMMLARAACDASKGPFAGFTLDTAQSEALHIASWLHDCGKVTTPEYVVDKATKLETIHDRIHEVLMRFEVLKRDAEIGYWRGLAAFGEEAALRRRRDAEWTQLDEEFAFVARCNLGGESLPPAHEARLHEIGARRWRRTLDDRLGISQDELQRRGREPAPTLPVEEPLLADKLEHRIPRPEGEGIAPDNRWGFRMDVPELLYNRGELHNLTVGRGTLSEEERYKINEHVVQTIKMLKDLPFPKHLQCVPEIAGGHHEKMDGTGYPRRLTGGKMSQLARMLAIADIFEALTAADRPYKVGKTLSQALAIMARMQREGHIDPELFELFLQSGVHQEYARQFLRPAQIDEVRIEDYLDTQAPEPD